MTGLLSSAYPPLVQGLHAAFFSHVRMEMASSPYVDARSREDLEQMFEGGASPREIADELLFTVASGWAHLSREKGVNVEVHSQFGIEALFTPMPRGNIAASSEDDLVVGRKADATAVAQEISRHHPSANRFLEIRYPLGTSGLETFFIVHAALNNYGLYLYAMEDKDVAVRLPSLTFFESVLKYCLGRRALTPCFAPGEVEPDVFNLIHKIGHHAIGEPMRRTRMHGRTAEPADYIIHDVGHWLEASIRLTYVQQRAAALLYEAGSVFLNRDNKLKQVWTLLSEDFGHLNNLEISPADDRTLPDILAKIRYYLITFYGQETVDRFFAFYRKQLDRFFKTDEKKNEGIKTELKAMRAELECIRVGGRE